MSSRPTRRLRRLTVSPRCSRTARRLACALARDHGVVLGEAEERVAAVLPSKSVALTLGIGVHEPVLLLDRVVRALDSGIPVEWRTAHCRWREGHYVADIR